MKVTKDVKYTIELEHRTFQLLLWFLSKHSWEELERMANGEFANHMKQLEVDMKKAEEE